MAIEAVQAIRKMRGGTQSQLMLGSDENAWVVKFQNNPQGIRVLANEWLVTGIAKAVGLPVPRMEAVHVAEHLVANVANDQEMYMQGMDGMRSLYAAGDHFGSTFVGGFMSVDFLPDSYLNKVSNLSTFAGILAVDKWTSNCDERQAVFYRKSKEQKEYTAVFIDQGLCFNAEQWDFTDDPSQGIYPRSLVYAGVTGWLSFEPWLSRIENIEFKTLWQIAETVPSLWYGGDVLQLESLMKQLFVRRERLRELIIAFRDSDRNPFPHWHY